MFSRVLSLFILSFFALSFAHANSCRGKQVIMTFDDGPSLGGSTQSIINTLKKYDVPAMFFLLGQKCNSRSEKICREIGDCDFFEAANHTTTHPNLNKVSDSRIQSEIRLLRENKYYQLARKGGEYEYFRAPYGACNQRVFKSLKKVDFDFYLNWDVDTLDWAIQAGLDGRKYGGDDYRGLSFEQKKIALIERAVRKLKSECQERDTPRLKDAAIVVLMHDIHSVTAAALPSIIVNYQRLGVEFVLPTEAKQTSSAWKYADPDDRPVRPPKND